jgi:hypothetical protein
MLVAPTTSRCATRPQEPQVKTRPFGFDTLAWQAGQVEEVPRSSMSVTVMPARVALSTKARVRCTLRHCRKRRL